MHGTRPSSVRVLARLLPALLCALCAFLVPPASAAAGAGGPAAAAAALAPESHIHAEPLAVDASARFAAPPASPAPGPPAAGTPAPVPDTQVSAAEAVELPAAVEQSVRFTAPPVAPPAVRVADEAPGAGPVEGDPRRERAPPGLPYDPTAPRGPPSTRHS
ncbi:hypothetical protein ACF1BN_07220 [Streptomyces sp. NPDC014861]|uniref:hypothetical protein n=1 Tax=Streptomyces sp. NPDC014861 TaxID=3364923 RepID=UPI0036F7FCA1